MTELHCQFQRQINNYLNRLGKAEASDQYDDECEGTMMEAAKKFSPEDYSNYLHKKVPRPGVFI